MLNQYNLHTIEVDNHVVYFWELNKTNPNVILLVHGLGGDHRGLLELGSLIQGYRVIVLDLPGYGLSEHLETPYTFTNYSKFLNSFRKNLGLDKFIVLGHSYGGSIVLKFAEQYPDKIQNLLLLNPISEANFTLTAKIGRLLVNFASRFPDPICKFLLSNKLSVYLTDRAVMTRAGKASRKRILEEDYVNYKRADLNALKDGLKELNNIELTKKILKYNNKCLILGANRDTVVSEHSVKRLNKFIEKSILVNVNGGHLFPLEKPKACGKIINYYLANNKSILDQA